MSNPIAFIDLKAQQARLGDRIPAAINRVLEHGQYIMGPEVQTLEGQLADFCGARHAISCANGTDALVMVLMAWGIGPGDAVLVPSFTFIATAEAVTLVGATPIFIDVRPDTFNLDVASLEAGIEEAKALSLVPKVVIPVDLFGQPADYPAILDLAKRHDLLVLADAAQGFGGRLGNRRVGTFATATTTSFFPAKPLGCYGDGGAIFTEDDALADLLRSIRVHGKGGDKYDNVRVGLNARLDTLQAAILIEKLAIFEDELEARQRVAARYAAALADVTRVPVLPRDAYSAWAQYTLVVDDRPALIAHCKEAGVPVQMYYPIPMHRQTGYAHYPSAPGGCPVSEDLASRAISLPMHPYLDEADQDRVIATVRRALT
jgi:dTDP-4-amino-4,6-dideoxygalactose transaminase